jgi:hypothetical protein
MLLRDYLFLNLGRQTELEAIKWAAEMTARRQVDAARDLLAVWRPRGSDQQFAAYLIVGLTRSLGGLTLATVRTRLEEAIAGAQAHYSGLVIDELTVEQLGDVAVGNLLMALGGHEAPAVANALAHYVEQAFGYAQASEHPVAFEESMRPKPL